MSNTVGNLRKKIDTAKDLSSVVRTMKAVSASSVGQYENSVLALADYFNSVQQGLGSCLRLSPKAYSYIEEKQEYVKNALVFGSDQGLVGQFNEIISDFAYKTLSELPGKARIWSVGERVHSRLIASGLDVVSSFDLPSTVKGIAPLVGEILLENQNANKQNESYELYIFYNRLYSGTATATVQRLLPMDQQWLRSLVETPWPFGRYSQIPGDLTKTLRALINEYLFVSLFRACAESLASENASRLAAMQRADKNIDELLKNLNGTFHRVRKNKIDEELFDVISAFDSLCDSAQTFASDYP